MSQAQLGQQSVDGADLDSCLTAAVAKFGRRDVILSIRGQERQGCKVLDDFRPRPWSGEALQQLLEHQPGREYGIPALESGGKTLDLRLRVNRIPAQRKGPHTRIDKQAHWRLRSAFTSKVSSHSSWPMRSRRRF